MRAEDGAPHQMMESTSGGESCEEVGGGVGRLDW